ncbi:MAG: DHHA1 domain-containing protein [bacterium]|nr:DHHA1 domain-containing protein [bacterium]
MIDLNKKNIPKAIKRLELAKKRNEKIALWGDYDADGISGTLIIYEALKDLGFENFLISLSGRKGIYNRGKVDIERFAIEGISLIISVDFGISAIEEVKFAREKGIDFIVLDHHTPLKVLPNGIIINYSNGRRAAAGVVLEFVKNLYRQEKRPKKEIEKFFDLVAIATVADKIILTAANKKIISQGIERIIEGYRPALRVLVKKIRIKKLTPDNFEHLIGRINFPKGIDEENNFFKLMSSKDKKEIKNLVNEIEIDYQKAQKIIGKILKENFAESAADKILPEVFFAENKFNWPQPGINGLVADEVSRKFKRPVFVFNHSGDKIKASGRAPKGLNLVKALRTCSADLFCNFGGHPRAAGFKAPVENLEKIKECLENYYKSGKHK